VLQCRVLHCVALCCSVWQCVAVCGNVLQCAAVGHEVVMHCGAKHHGDAGYLLHLMAVLQGVSVCCSVVCCSVLQSVAVCCSSSQSCSALWGEIHSKRSCGDDGYLLPLMSVLQCAAVRCVAVCCSAVCCTAVYCGMSRSSSALWREIRWRCWLFFFGHRQNFSKVSSIGTLLYLQVVN